MSAAFPLILVHGFPLDGRMWEGALPAGSGRTVLPLDLPGFRGTAAASPPGRMSDYARWVLERARDAGPGPYVFGGLSMGGYVLFELVRAAPTAVAGLVLADTRAEADTAEGRAARNDALSAIREGRRTEFLSGFGSRLLGPRAASMPGPSGRLRAMMRDATDAGLRYGLEAIRDRDDARFWLSSIQVPTLVVVGAEDVVTPPANAEVIRRGIAGSRLVTIPGAGHIPPMEEPEAFRAALDRFLEDNSL